MRMGLTFNGLRSLILLVPVLIPERDCQDIPDKAMVPIAPVPAVFMNCLRDISPGKVLLCPPQHEHPGRCHALLSDLWLSI